MDRRIKFMLVLLAGVYMINPHIETGRNVDISFRRVKTLDNVIQPVLNQIGAIVQGWKDGTYEIAEAEGRIVGELTVFLRQASNLSEDQISRSITGIAKNYPIFSRGWLARALEGLDEQQKGKIRAAINKVIEQAQQNKKVVRVIPVGPAGTRGYPFSTSGEYGNPKPLNISPEGKTLISYSVQRAGLGLGEEDVYIVTTQDIVDRIIREVDAEGSGIDSSRVFAQPLNANTLAAVGLTITLLSKVLGNDVVVSFMTTDHDIADLQKLQEAFSALETIAYLEPAVSILGIKPPALPEGANTNMGYIEQNRDIDTMVEDLYGIRTFKEKPLLEQAREYVAAGDLWNSGKGTASISTWFRALSEFAPDYSRRLTALAETIERVKTSKGITYLEAINDPEVKAAIADAYQEFQKNAKHYVNILVQPIPEQSLTLGLGVSSYDGNWTDLGSLSGRWTFEPKRPGTLVRAPVPGNVYYRDVVDSSILLQPDDNATQIHAYGLESTVIAYNKDNKTLVVVPMERDGNLKHIVNSITQDGNLRKYVVLETPTVTSTVRTGIGIINNGSNTVYLANGGDAFILPELITDGKAEVTQTTDSVIFSRDGLVCVSDMSGVIIIKDGDDIYVYGRGYEAEGRAHLARLGVGL